jgi:hypothetical protein
MKLSAEELSALKVKLLISGIKYRMIGGAFGVKRSYVCQVLNGTQQNDEIIKYIRSLPVPPNYQKIIRRLKQLKQAA